MAIIMINFNSWRHTLNCLESIKKEVRFIENVKIFLVDNASRDESCTQIRSYILEEQLLSIDFVSSNKNLGFPKGNNVGLRKALAEQFDYVMLLNNDTLLQGDICAAAVRFFDEHTDCTVIAAHTKRTFGTRELTCTRARPGFHDLLFLYHTPFWNREWFPGYRRHYMLDADLAHPFPVYAGSGACLIFRRQYFDAVGLFDEQTFLFAEEFIIGELCLQQGLKTLFMPEPVVIHFAGQSTKAVSAFSFIEYCRSEKYLCERYYGYGRLKMLTLQMVRFAKYLFRCAKSSDYLENASRFFGVYFR
jgi:GT2 family glycosyltransferase